MKYAKYDKLYCIGIGRIMHLSSWRRICNNDTYTESLPFHDSIPNIILETKHQQK